MQMYLNGEELEAEKGSKVTKLPDGHESSPLIVRLGRYFFDDTALIGKVLDVNMWDRSDDAVFIKQRHSFVDH